jgi:hypothetical protein
LVIRISDQKKKLTRPLSGASAMPSYRIGTLIYLDKKTNPYTQQDDARKENVLFEISTDD